MNLVQRIRAVVFDKDGVLADSEAINLRSAFEVFRAHGYELTAEDEPAIVGKHPMDYVPVLARTRAMRSVSSPAATCTTLRARLRSWGIQGRPGPCRV